MYSGLSSSISCLTSALSSLRNCFKELSSRRARAMWKTACRSLSCSMPFSNTRTLNDLMDQHAVWAITEMKPVPGIREDGKEGQEGESGTRAPHPPCEQEINDIGDGCSKASHDDL